MGTGIKSKVGEMTENKVVSAVVVDMTKQHQKLRINGVESENKLKNLEKEVKDRTLSELKESSYKESKAPKEELLNYVIIYEKGKKMSEEDVKDRIEKKSLDNNSINLSETNNVQVSQTTQQSPMLPQITTLSIGLNEQTNKEKILIDFMKFKNQFK